MNVVSDFRRPDNIRFGVTPISTTYWELAEAVLRTKAVVEDRLYERYLDTPTGVT